MSDNTDYTYQVRAIRPGGASAYAAPTDAITVAAVSGLVATAVSTSEIDLVWTTNITSPTGIEIDRSIDGTTFAALDTSGLAATATSYDDTTAVEGLHYYYRIKLTDASDSYSFSDAADTWTTPIQDLSNIPTTTGQVLSWTNIVPSGTTAIEVDRSDDNGTTWNVLTNSLPADGVSYTDSTLTPNVEALYRVCAIEASGPAPFTDSLDTFTLPQAPTALTVTNTSPTEVDLAWTSNASSTVSYFIERSDDGGTTFNIIDMTDAGATNHADTTVTDGGSYIYRVDAVCGDYINDNPSAPSESATAPLMPPTGLTAVANGQTEIDLSWNNASQSATGYSIERCTDGLTFTQIDTVAYADDTFYSDTTVLAGTQYYYRVIATGGGAPSAASNIATVASAPTVAISVGTTVKPGSDFILSTILNSAAGSVDPVVSWSITWGDGSDVQEVTGDPRTIDHTYTLPGAYTVTATAQTNYGVLTAAGNAVDANGNPLNYSVSHIAVPVPTLTLSASRSGLAVTVTPTLQLDGANSITQTVTNDDGSTTQFLYAVNFGDGSGINYYPANATGFSHTYPSDNAPNYGVTVSLVTSVGTVNAFTNAIFSTLFDPGYGGFNDWAINTESGFDWGPVNFQAFVYATSEFTSTVWGNPGDQRNLNWGDGTAVDIIIGDDGYVTVSHTYAQVGTYVARLIGSTSGEYPTNEAMLMYADTPTAVPYVTVPDIIVAAGQSFNLTVDCHNFTPSDSGNPVAFVDFHDGSGPQPATLTSGGSGTVSLTVPHAPGRRHLQRQHQFRRRRLLAAGEYRVARHAAGHDVQGLRVGRDDRRRDD